MSGRISLVIFVVTFFVASELCACAKATARMGQEWWEIASHTPSFILNLPLRMEWFPNYGKSLVYRDFEDFRAYVRRYLPDPHRAEKRLKNRYGDTRHTNIVGNMTAGMCVLSFSPVWRTGAGEALIVEILEKLAVADRPLHQNGRITFYLGVLALDLGPEVLANYREVLRRPEYLGFRSSSLYQATFLEGR